MPVDQAKCETETLLESRLARGSLPAGQPQAGMDAMEELFRRFASVVALSVEGIAALIIALGATEAIYTLVGTFVSNNASAGNRKRIWLRFGLWLLFGLEFELAADVVRTAISPTWAAIGQLAAIGAIRTFLNYALEKDLDKYIDAEAPDFVQKSASKPMEAASR